MILMIQTQAKLDVIEWGRSVLKRSIHQFWKLLRQGNGCFSGITGLECGFRKLRDTNFSKRRVLFAKLDVTPAH